MCWKNLSKDAASVYDGYKKHNPLMMRKKMAVKDVVFRKDEPERELLHLEFSFDTELYVLLAVGILFLILMVCKLCKRFH